MTSVTSGEVLFSSNENNLDECVAHPSQMGVQDFQFRSYTIIAIGISDA